MCTLSIQWLGSCADNFHKMTTAKTARATQPAQNVGLIPKGHFDYDIPNRVLKDGKSATELTENQNDDCACVRPLRWVFKDYSNRHSNLHARMKTNF